MPPPEGEERWTTGWDVIYEENYSFDNLYGGWEGVQGRANATNSTQISQAGTPYAYKLQNDLNLDLASVAGRLCGRHDDRSGRALRKQPVHGFSQMQYQLNRALRSLPYDGAVKAWVVRELGGPEVLRFEDLEPGEPADGAVRIAVRAAAINFPDALMVAGTYQSKPALPFVPGVEVSGEVIAAAPSTGFNAGDRVMALLDSGGLTRGGYSQLADAVPSAVSPMPAGMSFEEAAGFTLTYQTGWFGLHRRANLQPEETLLVHAGAGGVGTAAIQLGKAAGATVIATAGSNEKLEVCRRMGADHVINYKTQDFAEEVKKLTGGRGADVVFDPVGGDVYDRSTKCVAFEGRIVIVGFTSGRIAQAATSHVLVKNYSVVGLHWGLYRSRAPELIAPAARVLVDLYKSGKIKPFISVCMPLAEAPAALASVAGGKSTGKVVLTT